MKKITIALAFCIVFFSGQAFAQTKQDDSKPVYDAELAKKLGADEYGMRSYVHVLLKTGEAKITDKKKRAKIFSGHFSNMGRLSKEGILVAAGPFDDPKGIKRGFFIFNVSTIEEAEKLVVTDPAVKSGIFKVELTKLYTSAALMMINDIHGKIQKTPIP
jgi:uncharacterized protein YciI